MISLNGVPTLRCLKSTKSYLDHGIPNITSPKLRLTQYLVIQLVIQLKDDPFNVDLVFNYKPSLMKINTAIVRIDTDGCQSLIWGIFIVTTFKLKHVVQIGILPTSSSAELYLFFLNQ